MDLDRSITWRSALLQAGSVALLSIALALALPKSFFVDWGWLAGPGAWALCALLTATLLRLPLGPTLIGATLAGIPGLLGVITGVHWLGVVLAIPVFALWCGALAARRGPSPAPV